MIATLPSSQYEELFARLAILPRRISSDSRRIRTGDAFAAYPGQADDGRRYIADAIARDAGIVLWEPKDFVWSPQWNVPNRAVDELKQALGTIASFIYHHPSRSLFVVGVTGTNGKTSCSNWIAQCLDACGRRAAVIGTLGTGLVGALSPSANTTPDAALVHETLASVKAAGAVAVAMEVSSHGLDQGRVNGVEFDVALFTNLSRDHLDYHGTMTAYGETKAKLLAWPGLETAVINIDDPFGQALAKAAKPRGQHVLTYGLADADIVATSLDLSQSGIAMSVVTPCGQGEIATKLLGAFNASNLLGVLGVLIASGIGLDDAIGALSHVEAPAGRMQRLGGETQPLVVVDYAHTPDALEKALTALQPAVMRPGELICVFGCGGDRDTGKRPEMGRIAGYLADRVIITNDNPRTEDPAAIAADIVRGIRDCDSKHCTVLLDRAQAIEAAIADARRGDVVLIAGKGHEDYQEARGVRSRFSDADVARAALARKRVA
jgi:UDP-N-acetylmuramoyl-L-alanyl-D-glutamate--2,6-diaminopimelate ligase